MELVKERTIELHSFVSFIIKLSSSSALILPFLLLLYHVRVCQNPQRWRKWKRFVQPDFLDSDLAAAACVGLL